jgi:hypothetical protein
MLTARAGAGLRHSGGADPPRTPGGGNRAKAGAREPYVGDVPAEKLVLLGRYEPKAAELAERTLALVEVDAGFDRPLLPRLRDDYMTAAPHRGRGIQ